MSQNIVAVLSRVDTSCEFSLVDHETIDLEFDVVNSSCYHGGSRRDIWKYVSIDKSELKFERRSRGETSERHFNFVKDGVFSCSGYSFYLEDQEAVKRREGGEDGIGDDLNFFENELLHAESGNGEVTFFANGIDETGEGYS